MKIAFFTLGCKVNQYETQAMEAEAAARGHDIVPFESMADGYVINSCCVTAAGDRKSRTAARAARRRCPEAVVAVCGCYVQAGADAEAALPEADILFGTRDRLALIRELERAYERRGPRAKTVRVGDIFKAREYERLSAGHYHGRTRALLKIEDGCVNFCTYCIIPHTRGPVRSLPPGEAETEARRLARGGAREIVLTGIEISSYGADLPADEACDLAELVRRLCTALPDCRFRLGSLEPRTVDDDFVAKLSPLENLCAHFHLSLQSGCDRTLSAMHRRYTGERFAHSLRLLRDGFGGCAVTTDLIVGFPGESEADFDASLDFVRRCRFAAMHVFPYSRRSGTPAADMPDQLTRAQKADRAVLAGALAAEMQREYLAGQAGRVLRVLFESEQDGTSSGHSENYVEVRVAASGLCGQVLPVRVVACGDAYVEGALL